MKKTKIMKTELEEAAKFNYDNKTSRIPVPTSHWINSEFLQIQNFIEGANWQAERMYSEEDMLKFAWFLIENVGQYSCDRTAHFEGKYLEKFKKKA